MLHWLAENELGTNKRTLTSKKLTNFVYKLCLTVLYTASLYGNIYIFHISKTYTKNHHHENMQVHHVQLWHDSWLSVRLISIEVSSKINGCLVFINLEIMRLSNKFIPWFYSTITSKYWFRLFTRFISWYYFGFISRYNVVSEEMTEKKMNFNNQFEYAWLFCLIWRTVTLSVDRLLTLYYCNIVTL